MPFVFGEESDYLSYFLLLDWWLGNVRSGLSSSVGCEDMKHSAALRFTAFLPPLDFRLLVISMVYSCAS